MANVLVIHPDDRSTDFLKLVYQNKGYDVISNCFLKKEELFNEIKKHDKIIMLGHGTPRGLLNPKRGGYIIDDDFADLLKTKETISMWCYSDMYFRRHGIPGWHSSMIISEIAEELWMLGKIELNKSDLLKNMEHLATVFGECIDRSPEEIQEYMLANYTGDDEVTKFNRNNFKIIC